ncbi:DeoR/GlpR family DNA-binding transcription regulator [Aporhodopirellula aestuarii]|uniref:DeoR/GlpR family DNA-binding transcription regulator n=1 Tax=Aporhodopirellula aestuarii TaxID=2950107 RepID=A0ABT0TY46_9BACT|nr:DeoR/GlpR family DNA-binding transcription regulator [Aporhodopirellula aestuarii]MCM2369528.1 DeoR/GlpR family DNA-binding transcription regulator [Aporhodopirellula aestuarii]
MSTESRREKLRDHVRAQGFAALGELSSILGVSESTVRRDLEVLEDAGQTRRTHGGVYWTGETDTIGTFRSHRDDGWPRKQAIGRLASSFIEDGDTILLDGGSTVYELARLIVNRTLQVVTNSLPVAHLLSTSDSIDLVMIGGCVRRRTSVTIGPMADAMLADINVAKTFLSVAGVTERGFFNSDMMLVESEKAMIAAADQTIVLADSSKFGKVSLSQICRLGEVNRILTDGELENRWKSTCESAGVELQLAPVEPSSSSMALPPLGTTDHPNFSQNSSLSPSSHHADSANSL